MKIVVTGPTGHVGLCLVQRLLALGHDVRAMVHSDPDCLDGLDVERVPGDVRDIDSLRAAFADQEAVIHLAAFISVDPRDEPLMREVNVGGVRNTATAALEQGVRRMVHVSSVHAFDTWRLPHALTEVHAKAERPDLPTYDRSKAAGEVALQEVIAQGLDAVILNPVGIIGPLDHRPSLMGGVLRTMLGGYMPAVPDGGFCWVDVRDVCDTIVTAISRGETGQNYLLSSEPVSNPEFHTMARRANGGRFKAIPVPIWMLRLVSPFTPPLARFSPMLKGFTTDALHALDAQLTVDPTKARRVLGFQPRPMTETMADAIEWWENNDCIASPRLRLRARPKALPPVRTA
jgi:dihydroflavonol-4-reductase